MSDLTFIDDDDLALYILGLLSPSESASMAQRLSAESDLQSRLARMQLALGAFAEETVELVDVPANSRDRLMQSVANNADALTQVATHQAFQLIASRKLRLVDWLGWMGWPLAAALALFVFASVLPRQAALQQQLLVSNQRVQQGLAEAHQSEVQQTALKGALQDSSAQIARSETKVSDAEQQAAALRERADNALTRANRESARVSGLASTAAETARERDELRRSADSQARQAAEVSAQSADAQSILSALNDPSALNVSLKVPKQKRSPSGRGTYVASSGALVFVGNNLPQLASNKVYELWLMPLNGSNPIPAGTFVPDAAGNARVVTPRFRQNIAAKSFAVTAENSGGSKTPTLPILLAGS